MPYLPHGVKQGWSGFGAAPAPGEECTENAATLRVLASPEAKRALTLASSGDDTSGGLSAQSIDLTSRAMHTTGTVGPCNRKIVAVLTLEPTTITWQDSAKRITDLTRAGYRHRAVD
ncbi:MAG TPA: hypothetical protein VJT49_10190 [Amycolatopsis sp.]|uniref:hypothetical protein n=1 Tax=Amycolatopsis sp. TaxID=37632 RepID=UPI002B475EA4|nr:hypothetical protein [Amycolatopsis sp.]HKS45467.1 hypothetical protein [Amycolatopsis sp.]